ncbi:hypothetical protein ARC78_07810 [Stenotrophomonas pictorum JCM 9942]|uniref:Carboxypeptidase regulatory-like domain-containing protein n=1 Tax=Stenotrophomonas pictorum JCM 9942 TaxID=1236960 RepID=A0A0R0AS03_9GAMM|nr:hypothetical protein [Stenotrophomonas pictorum]KRG42883.1 hypothetical protein ARC78_07810 [Stenotrophomonas pictorum JCM 9942]
MMSWLPLIVIALAVLLASARLSRAPRPAPLRLGVLLLLQLLAAALLYFTLLPPERPGQAETLVIATRGATATQLAAQPAAIQLRLPEAPQLAGAAPVPDLATALRQHPGARALVIVGDGLPARDRDLPLPPLQFVPGPAPRGLVELQAPPPLAPGARFSVGSRVQGLAQVRLELRDPAGHRVAIATPDTDGRVRLHASARAPGDVAFSLRVLDGTGKVLDQLPVPVRVREVPAPTLRLLAAAPGPELKYLQRWASDTGARLQTGIQVGGGVQLGDAPQALDAASLARLDLLLLDERRLAALSSAQRGVLTEAMRTGLGVLVRMGGPLEGNARRALHDWGLVTRGGEQTGPLKLPGDSRAGDTASSTSLPALERFRLEIEDEAAVPLLHAADGSGIGAWRALGQGRLGLLPVSDSYTLVLAGHGDRHAELWNQVLATLARPLPAAPLSPLPAWGWSGEHNTLCDLPAGAQVIAPDGRRSDLLPDPQAGHCSGWWPTRPGWHTLTAGDTQAGVLLLDPAHARALHAQQTREATFALRGHAGRGGGVPVPVPGPRWPWLLAFVLVASLLWWLERRRSIETPSP